METFEPLSVAKLSITDIGLGADCLAKLYFKLKYGPEPPKGATITGSAFHRGVEVGLRETAKKGKLPPLDTCTDAYRDLFYAASLDANFEDGKPREWEKKGLDAIRVYHEKAMPTFEPEDEGCIERPFAVITASGRKITGKIDLVLPDRIVDHKTTSSSSLKNAAKGMQYLGYQLPLEEPTTFEYSVVNFRGRYERFAFTPSAEAVKNFVALAERLMILLENGLIIPNPRSFLCSEKWCAWYKRCPFSRSLWGVH